MEHINVQEKVLIDDSILSWEVLSFEPFNPTKLGLNDEIRISLQQTGKYPLPCKSELYLELKVTKEDGMPLTNTYLINNAAAFLFKELRYVLNGVTIDSVRDIGITSTMKGYLSYNLNESVKLQNAGWYPAEKKEKIIMVDSNGNVSLCIPLKMYSGFFEDYKKIILNSHQELILVRANDDSNALVQTAESTEKPRLTITKLCWRVPHLTVAIPQELALTKIIDKNIDILLTFRSWELVEYPELLETTRHNWPVKTSTKIETPRHVILAFQKDKRDNLKKDMSKFDHCDLRNVNVYLNSERYPYGDLQLDFKNNKFATLYEMFSEFRQVYYNNTQESIFTPSEFKDKAPLVYINCTHQRDLLQTGPVTMRVEFETAEKMSDKTTAYCLIIHDKIFSYNPLTKIVKQL
ncbi:uncharacterized protein [Euwallacea fornicatus]|uniref:uncharacterized protein n=1 Tax=Euwallacea fornicatus TaxID=995702 RepID=UPI0033904293